MQDTIDALRATIEIAARQGSAQARIALQPDELGHITIRLLQTSEGLRASVYADTLAGTQAISQARSELHQTLTSLGVSLLHLDIGSSGQFSAGTGRDPAGQAPTSGSSTPGLFGAGAEEDPPATGTPTSQPPGPALGEIVDVLA